MPALLITLAGIGLVRVTGWRPSMRTLLRAAAVICVAAFALYVCHYGFVSGVYDHLEPTVVEIVRRTAAGEPAYHALDAASRYSMLYGPNVYGVPALATALAGHSLGAMKWLSAAFTLASLGLTMLAWRAAVKPGPARAAGLIYFCGAALLFREKLVWVRGDPQLLFWAAVAVWGAGWRRPAAAFAAIGLALGGCMNTKLHGALYVVPALALAWPRADPRAWLALLASAGGACALPFLASPALDLAPYLEWLRIAARHGLSPEKALDTARCALLLVLPLLLGGQHWLAQRTPSERAEFFRRHGRGLLLAGGSVGALIVLAAKNGGGEWHLLPLVPSFAVLFALAWREETARTPVVGRGAWRIGLATLALYAVLGGAIAAARVPIRLRADAVFTRPVREDLQRLVARHATETMALGAAGDGTYARSFLRTELPPGQPLAVDAGALMDMQQGGLAIPPATLDRVRSGAIKLWIVPRGERPFTVRNFYAGQDLFGAEFRQAFLASYRRTESTAFFDLWTFGH